MWVCVLGCLSASALWWTGDLSQGVPCLHPVSRWCWLQHHTSELSDISDKLYKVTLVQQWVWVRVFHWEKSLFFILYVLFWPIKKTHHFLKYCCVWSLSGHFSFFLCSVTSSEKVDKAQRYADFTLLSVPYPGELLVYILCDSTRTRLSGAVWFQSWNQFIFYTAWVKYHLCRWEELAVCGY